MGRALPHARFALAVLLGLAWPAAPPASAQSQGLVVRDGSLGSAPAGVVQPGLDDLGQRADYLIRADLGEQRGGNLFHSFVQFSIGSGERATFTAQGAPDPGAIDNVISRVRGGEASRIDGTLHSTIPGAGIWLLNPSGVVFGAGAELDVTGSFHASTGDYVGFEGGLEGFYVDGRPSSVLSTARPEAFGFLPGGGAASLAVEGRLDVARGQAKLLEGGDVSLSEAELRAPGGRLSLEASGEVALSHSLVDVGREGDTPGTLSIRGGQILIEGGSQVLAENESPVPVDPSVPGPGSISIAASESVLVDDSVLSVDTSSAGNAGTVRLVGPSEDRPIPVVTIQNGPGLPSTEIPRVTARGVRAYTTGTGAGGEIYIDAGELTIRNGVAVDATAIGSVSPVARGHAGTVEIHARSIEVSDRSYIGAAGWGSTGRAGSIQIDLGDEGSLVVDGRTDHPRVQGPRYAWIITSSHGTSGTIEIRGGSVRVSNGGSITSSCNPGCIASGGHETGAIQIVADRIGLETGGGIFAATRGAGDAGTIILDTASLVIESGGSISASTSSFDGSSGNAGSIAVDADSVAIQGGSIASSTSGTGLGGDITLDAGSISIENGGLVDAGTTASGHAGSITLDADSVALRSGGIITTTSRNPGSGSGDAGTIAVTAADSILLDHEDGPAFSLLEAAKGTLALTGVFAATGGGRGGSITLDAPDITVTNGAIVATSTVGGGNAGDVRLSGDRIHILDGGFVDSTSVPSPDRGAPGGAAGSVTLDAQELIEVVGRRRVMPGDTPYEEWSHVSSAALGSGAPGTVTLTARRIVVDGGAVATTAVASESARGTVEIHAGELLVTNGGRIDASTFVADRGGSIDVTATDSIAIAGAGSGIASRTGGEGTGGDLALRAPRIEVSGGAEVTAESTPGLGELREIFGSLFEEGLIPEPPGDATGNAGSIALAASQLVHLDDGDITTSSPRGQASGGDISIDPVFVILQHGSRIEAIADKGQGGHIQITTDNFFAFPGSVVSAASGNQALSGTVEIHSPDVNLAGTLAELPSTFLDAASLMRERCAARRSGERVGSFSVRGPGGIPAEPDGWLPAPLLPDAVTTTAAVQAEPLRVARLAGPVLLHAGCP